MATAPRQLILIKHAKPLTDPNRPSHEWGLSDEGRRQCATLADRLRSYDFSTVVSSDEPKAIETAKLLADALAKPTEVIEGLHEHDRSNVPMMRTADFISYMEIFFRRPENLILGTETANQAEDRFTDALEELLQTHPAGDIAVVSHGTVLALYLARLLDQDPFSLWRKMALPSYAVIQWPDEKLLEMVERL